MDCEEGEDDADERPGGEKSAGKNQRDQHFRRRDPALFFRGLRVVVGRGGIRRSGRLVFEVVPGDVLGDVEAVLFVVVFLCVGHGFISKN